jgi:outer membrane protein assembly factor BamB
MSFLKWLLLVAITALTALGENWPAWRGRFQNGSTSETNFPTAWSTNLNVKWRVPLPERGNSSPIVWKNWVFLTQAIGKQRALMCIDRDAGRVLWTAGPVYEAPETTYSENNPYCASSPVTDGERVIAYFASAGLYCFNFKGKELWHLDLGKIEHIFGYASSPCLAGDFVYVYVGPGEEPQAMVAVNKKTGKIAWKTEPLLPRPQDLAKVTTNGPPVGSWSTPIVIENRGRKELIMSFAFRFGSYDAANGKLLWEHDGFGLQTYVTPLWTDGLLIPMGAMATLAYRPPAPGQSKGEDIWTQPKAKFRFGSSVATEKYLFDITENGLAECWEKSTGKVLWQERLQGPGKKTSSWSSVTMAGGKIYAPNQSGDIFVFAAEPTFKIISTNSIPEPTNASLALSQGSIYLRTDEALWRFSSN